jgi:hypothetical protein
MATQGTSSHVTSRAGATVEIEFMGVAVSLYGQGTAGAYTTVLDSGSPVSGSPSGSMLATYGGLNDTVKHKIELRVTESQPLSLSYATFTIRSDLASTSVKSYLFKVYLKLKLFFFVARSSIPHRSLLRPGQIMR